MTLYQNIVRAHLERIFKRGNAVTVDVVLQSSEKEFVTDLCLEFGYIPCYGIDLCGYTTMNAVKLFIQ